jgi:hypothetical protein
MVGTRWEPAEDAQLVGAIKFHSHWEVSSDGRVTNSPRLRVNWPAVLEQMGMTDERRARRRWFYLNPENEAAVQRQRQRRRGWARRRRVSLLADLEEIPAEALFQLLPGPVQTPPPPRPAPVIAFSEVQSVARPPGTKRRVASFVFTPTNLGRAAFSIHSLRSETEATKRSGGPIKTVVRSLTNAFDAAIGMKGRPATCG